MSWRPEGWKNRFSIASGADPADGERFIDYEAGADAMLGALKKRGIDLRVYADHLRFGIDRGAKVLEGKEDTVTYQGVKGTLVFIPDKEG